VGSGTTAIAAAELGRQCLGYDISERYIEVAEKRLAASVGRGRQLTLDTGATDTAEAIA
jgi:DNA modification methylase